MKKQVPEHPVTKNRAELTHTGFSPKDFTPLTVITALLVTSYLTANIMAVKIIGSVGVAVLDAGTITFPLAYILGDVLTEIWGFKIARKVILLTFVCNIVLVAATWIGVIIPSPDYLSDMEGAYNTVFSYVPRIVAASLIAFIAGELSNSWFMDRIKRLTKGRYLWVRTIGSSMVGYVFDTAIFCIVAFGGTVHLRDMFLMIAGQYVVKIVIEAVCGTPIAYLVIWLLRRYNVGRGYGGNVDSGGNGDRDGDADRIGHSDMNEHVACDEHANMDGDAAWNERIAQGEER